MSYLSANLVIILRKSPKYGVRAPLCSVRPAAPRAPVVTPGRVSNGHIWVQPSPPLLADIINYPDPNGQRSLAVHFAGRASSEPSARPFLLKVKKLLAGTERGGWRRRYNGGQCHRANK